MTEDEAKTKLCPQVIHTIEDAECVGSRCMAWRWDYQIMEMIQLPDQKYMVFRFPVDQKPRGYCGLAQRPAT